MLLILVLLRKQGHKVVVRCPVCHRLRSHLRHLNCVAGEDPIRKLVRIGDGMVLLVVTVSTTSATTGVENRSCVIICRPLIVAAIEATGAEVH